MAKSKLLETMQAAGLRPEDEDVTPGGSDAHINENTSPDEPAVGSGPVTGPPAPSVGPSLAADLGRTASDRLSALEQKQSQLNAPDSTKAKIFKSLAMALPTVAGALSGGVYGASGAAQGTASAIEEGRQRQLQQNSLLNQQIEAERGRQEKATDLAAQLEEKRNEAAMRQKELDEATAARLQVAQTAAASRQSIADTNKTSRLAAVAGKVVTKIIDGKPHLFSLNPDTGEYSKDEGEAYEKPQAQTTHESELAAFNASPDAQKYGPGEEGLRKRNLADDLNKAQTLENMRIADQKTARSEARSDAANQKRADQAAQERYKTDKVYDSAMDGNEEISNTVQLARNGNKEAQAALPMMMVNKINSLSGIKRSNQAEINSLGPQVGSLIDNINGKLGKLKSGQPIPPDVLDDAKKLFDSMAANATSARSRAYSTIDKDFGSSYADELKPKANLGQDSGLSIPYKGKTYTFPNQAAANKFKAEVGIK